MTTKEKLGHLEARNNELCHLLDDMTARMGKVVERHTTLLQGLENLEARNNELKSRISELEKIPKTYNEDRPENGYFHSKNHAELGFNFRLIMTTMHELLFCHYDPEKAGIDLSREAVQGIGVGIGMALEAITGESMYQRD